MSVPAFAQSSAGGGRSPRSPRPSTVTASPRWPSTRTPLASTASSVAPVSAESSGRATLTPSR